jgi:hypothetical protein
MYFLCGPRRAKAQGDIGGMLSSNAAVNMHPQRCETEFSVGSVQRSYLKTKRRVEAGSNTSTVALRVVGGDENGTQCLG